MVSTILGDDEAVRNGFTERDSTTVAEAGRAAAPVRAVAAPIKPPRGGMVDFGLTDAGMLVIFDPECMDADYAISLVALITELDLVNVDSEATS